MRIALLTKLPERLAAGYSENYWILTRAGRIEPFPIKIEGLRN